MFRLAIWLLSFTYAIQDRCIKKPQFCYTIDWETPGSVYTRSIRRIIIAHYHDTTARVFRKLVSLSPSTIKSSHGISPFALYIAHWRNIPN